MISIFEQQHMLPHIQLYIFLAVAAPGQLFAMACKAKNKKKVACHSFWTLFHVNQLKPTPTPTTAHTHTHSHANMSLIIYYLKIFISFQFNNAKVQRCKGAKEGEMGWSTVNVVFAFLD